ncbi:hypothetical protein [Paraburkholderia flagellata]|nr:hypothetical protein [Paraburkholderia flagellata]
MSTPLERVESEELLHERLLLVLAAGRGDFLDGGECLVRSHVSHK